MKKQYKAKIKQKVLNNGRNTSGITLIALIITIIILLILAGVTISAIIGDNSILTEAGDAKKETRYAAIEEEIELALDAIVSERFELANQKVYGLLEELDEKYEFVDEFETEIKNGETVEVDVKIDNSEYLFKIVEEGIETYFTVNFEENTVTVLDGTDHEVTIYGKERTITFATPEHFIANNRSNIIAEYTTNNNKKMKLPKIPTYQYYTHIGWDTNNDGRPDIGNDVTETRVLKDEKWIALYKVEGESEVRVVNGTLSNESDYGVYTIDTVLTIKATNTLDGKYFNGWTFDGGESIVSCNQNYKFTLKGDANIMAIYGDNPVVKEPKVGFYDCYRILDEETNKERVYMPILWDANISGYTLLEKGILRTYEEGSVTNLSLDMIGIDNNIKHHICTNTAKMGGYALSVNIGAESENKNKNLYVKGYITYKTPDGNINTTYTTVKCLEKLVK